MALAAPQPLAAEQALAPLRRRADRIRSARVPPPVVGRIERQQRSLERCQSPANAAWLEHARELAGDLDLGALRARIADRRHLVAVITGGQMVVVDQDTAGRLASTLAEAAGAGIRLAA